VKKWRSGVATARNSSILRATFMNCSIAPQWMLEPNAPWGTG
jgi:hypothetical protein